MVHDQHFDRSFCGLEPESQLLLHRSKKDARCLIGTVSQLTVLQEVTVTSFETCLIDDRPARRASQTVGNFRHRQMARRRYAGSQLGGSFKSRFCNDKVVTEWKAGT